MPDLGLDRSSRSLDWPSAAAIGAGIFFLAASLSGWGPWGALEDAAWRRLARTQAGEVAPARALALEEDESELPTPGARARRLAEDIERLRALDPGLIVLEALPDEPSEAAERDVLERLAAGLAPATKVSKKKPGKDLQAVALKLSAAAAGLDADERLARALTSTAKLLMAFSARPSQGETAAPPACLDRSGFEVALKSAGKQSLTRRWEVLRAPLAAFCAQGAAAALPLEAPGESRETGLVMVAERWHPTLGLEAARRWFEVPAKGMRFHWVRGRLVSLELKGVRYPLDAQGDFLLGDAPPMLHLGLSDLRAGKLDKSAVIGRVVFLRPWPSRLAEAPAFDRQRRLFNALCARALRVDSAPAARVWLWALSALALAISLGFAPWWAAVPLALAVLAGIWSSYLQQEALARPLGAWLGAVFVGVGWAAARWHARREKARRWFLGSVAPAQETVWRKRLPLPGKDTALHGLYALWQASSPMHEHVLEAWAAEHGAFLDPARAGGFFLALDEPKDPAALLAALRALKELDPKATLAISLGEVTFSAALRLGVARWSLKGKGIQLALGLAAFAQNGQILLSEPDYFVLRDGIRVQLTGRSLPDPRVPGDEAKVLNILSFVS